VNLLCRLGRHRPRGIPRWNDGYYFATCEKCGADLVRTAFQRWHVPEGYRVVWSDRPPASRPEVALVPGAKDPPTPFALPDARSEPAYEPDPPAAAAPPEPMQGDLPGPAAPSPSDRSPAEAPAEPAEAAGADERLPVDSPVPPSGSRNGRLPIEEVLAQLNAEDAANRSPENAPTPTEAPAQRRRSSWDFMDDESLKEGAALAPGPGAPARPPAPGSPPRADSGEAGSSGPPGGRGGERARRIRSAVRDFWSGPGEPRPILVVALAMAVAVAAALALALPSAPSPSGGPGASSRPGAGGRPGVKEAADPFATDASFAEPEAEGEAARGQEAQSAGAESPEDRGYVVASLLSCRDAPVLQARRVRNLARGQEVRILAIEGEWASLTYRGGQCWAQARFISPVPPL
jgi:hypothetical protein